MSILPELRALGRCLRLAGGLGVLWGFARGDGRDLLRSVDEVVMPLVRQSITDVEDQDRCRQAFQTAAIKFGIGICTYTRMAGRPVNVPLVAISTSFTRLYDDLIDYGTDDALDDRFDDLIRGVASPAVSRLEQLLHRMFAAVESVAAIDRAAPFHRDVAQVHGWQHRSRLQRAKGLLTLAELVDITRGKGAGGILVLYTLGHGDVISVEERSIIADIGFVGQMLDDQHDLPIDRMDGIVTPATLGEVGAVDVGRDVARLAGRLRRHFGTRAARPFGGLLFLYQAGLVTRRMKPKPMPVRARTAPLSILFGRTRDIAPVRSEEIRPLARVGRSE